MAKDQSNDITEQVGDTPETVVEKTETMQPVTQTIVKKTGTALSFIGDSHCARCGWGWLLFWSATSS